METSRELLAKLIEKGLTLREISEKTGISRSQLSRVSQGKRTLSEQPYRKLLGIAKKKPIKC